MCFSISMFAQQFTIKEMQSFPSNFNLTNDKTIDTLTGPVFSTSLTCKDSLTYYDVGTGYLTGNGVLSGTVSLTECAQGFDNASNLTVNGAVVLIGKISGNTGSMTAKVYDVDGAFSPLTSSSTSDAVSTNGLAALPSVNQVPFIFSTPPTVSGNFAISVVYPTTSGDTIIVAQTRAGCVDAAKDGYAYVNTTIGWMQYKALMSQMSMGSFDLFVFAVVSTPSSVLENPMNAVLNVYPSPADEFVNIVSLSEIRKISINNLNGQTVLSTEANGYLFNLNTSGLNAGVYIIQVETIKGTIWKKFSIE